MPLEPHEELKLAWEIAVMDMQLDRGRLDIEKIRQDIDKTRLDIDKTRLDIDKTRADMSLDVERLRAQNRATTATMLGAFAATLAAGAAIGHFFIK